ncbi:MAG: hypothetical protein ABI967_06325 [bacterium]
MSKLKLNLIDSQKILTGTIHGSVVDSCIAALSAEPETIPELAAALGRYIRHANDSNPFAWFHPRSSIDEQPYDAGIALIDLAARIIAAESTYSNPQPDGEVSYHDGHQATDVSIFYRLPDDWLIVHSIEAYQWSRERRVEQRAMPVDFRAVLYGVPLLEFIVESMTPELRSYFSSEISDSGVSAPAIPTSEISDLQISNPGLSESAIPNPEIPNPLAHLHATWLTTARADLQDSSPRDIILAKREFIDFDLHTRSMQWDLLNEGPPCLARDSFAYRFAGFGTHEWVVYYDLVRYLLECAVDLEFENSTEAVHQLGQLKDVWLEYGNGEFDGRTPAVIIDNERKRLPEAMSPEQIIIDEECECCRMLAGDAEMGFGNTYWHLDGSHMEDEFAFSTCKTFAEWELENQRREESYCEFEREWAEREQARRAEIREWDEERMRLEMNAILEADDAGPVREPSPF